MNLNEYYTVVLSIQKYNGTHYRQIMVQRDPEPLTRALIEKLVLEAFWEVHESSAKKELYENN